MIRFKITSVARRASMQANTKRYTYHQDKPREVAQYHGAEWEEVEFQLVEELEPPIGIANFDASALLLGTIGRLLVNLPELFGQFKVGDIINFVPVREVVESNGQEIPQEPPEETIVIPKLV
ncbi:MAG TPA: hypothetical protein VF077_09745 [Nitrospiraceae bacterium]